jgi:cell division protein FtsI/penicillin-binding protein 2
LTFAEAFAQSFNVVFAQLAIELGADKLEQYAERLGLLEPVGWRAETLFKLGPFRQIDGEDPGQLFAPGTPRNDGGVLAQTAIGQRDVQMTPLQAAYLAATIARDGQAVAPRLVQSLHYRTGELLTEFAPQRRADAPLSPMTIRQLRQLLRKVVEEGTGVALQAAQWPLAGKSGTGEYVKGKTDNQWFVGYGPADAPRYAVAVVSMDTPAEEKNKAVPVFLKVMDHLATGKN